MLGSEVQLKIVSLPLFKLYQQVSGVPVTFVLINCEALLYVSPFNGYSIVMFEIRVVAIPSVIAITKNDL